LIEDAGEGGQGEGLTVGHVDEETVVDNPNSVLEGLGGRLDVLDGLLEGDCAPHRDRKPISNQWPVTSMPFKARTHADGL